MSKEHLCALENTLLRNGWRIVTVHPGDSYRISATWELQRGGSRNLFIDFEGLSPDGGTCLPLEQSYGCQVRGEAARALYFRKLNRSRELWEIELTEFATSMGDSTHE
jgi:hypothetical protein